MATKPRHKRKTTPVVPRKTLKAEIAAHRRTELALRIRNQILESSIAALALANLDGRMTYVNRAFLELWGYESPNDVLGRSVLQFWRDPENARRAVVGLFECGVWTGELVARRKDDTLLTVHLSSNLVRDDDGTPMFMMASFIDITDRIRIEKALRKSEDLFRTFFHASPIGMAVVDEQLRYTYVNAELARMNGRPPEEHFGRTIHEMVPPVAGIVGPILQEVLDTGTTLRNLELKGENGDIPCSWVGSFFPLLGDGAAPSGVGVLVVDETERERFARNLRESEEKLRQLASELSLSEERERRRLAIGLHDNVGQVLALAKIRLGALRERITERDLGKEIDEIRGCCDQAIHYTRTLTADLSPPVLYDLGLEAAVEWLLDHQLARMNVRVRFRDDGRPKPLSDDVRVVLFQGVRELLLNAAKHSEAGRLEVAVRRKGREIQVEVTDDGVGFRGQGQDSLARGKGFGLFSIRERLGLLGGRMEIDTAPGRGTRAVLVAPLKRSRKK